MRSASRMLAAAVAALSLALASGCATNDIGYINLDASNPSLELSAKGLTLNGRPVDPRKVPEILEEFEVPKDHVINVRIKDINDFDGRIAMAFKRLLAQHGYSRTTIVTKEHAESWSSTSRRMQK